MAKPTSAFVKKGFRRRILKTPLGYISFHSALSQLGSQRMPGIWARGPEWSKVPFVERSGQLGWWMPTGKSHVWISIEIDSGSIKATTLANSRFWKIADELFAILKSERVVAYVVADGDKPTKIAKGSIRWDQQAKTIACSGYMMWSKNSEPDKRRRVVLKSKAWSKWLCPDRPDKDFNKADPQLCSDIIAVLSDHAKILPEFRYAYSTLWKMVSADMLGILRPADFKRRIYSALGDDIIRNDGKRGRSFNADEKALMDMKASLRVSVQKVAADFRARVSGEEG